MCHSAMVWDSLCKLAMSFCKTKCKVWMVTFAIRWTIKRSKPLLRTLHNQTLTKIWILFALDTELNTVSKEMLANLKILLKKKVLQKKLSLQLRQLTQTQPTKQMLCKSGSLDLSRNKHQTQHLQKIVLKPNQFWLLKTRPKTQSPHQQTPTQIKTRKNESRW